jgi:uncharacterized membrane protein
MMADLLLYLHILGATVLLGTGAGIAFFMVMSNRSQDPALIAHVAGIVVLADMVFTATAAIAQPITGYLLARHAGWPLFENWLGLALILYAIVGIFWLPVVWIQMKMRDLAISARNNGEALPLAYKRLYRIWFVCGFPAFFSVLGIVWLMLFKPDL